MRGRPRRSPSTWPTSRPPRGPTSPAAFSSAASPGVVSLFFANQHYPTDEEYLFAIAEAMRAEYEAIAAAGVTVQLDCPDLAMGRHSAYAGMDLAAFRRRAALNIEALNHAVRNIPAEQLRMHLCWGNYPGPHHHDVDLADIIDLVWQAKPRTVLFEAAEPAPRPRVDAVRGRVALPDDKILCPGVIEPQSNYIEHPELVAQRIGRYADLVGRDRVMAGVDCGFSVHVGMQGIDPDVAWAKLAPPPPGRGGGAPTPPGVGLAVAPPYFSQRTRTWPWTPARGTTGLPAPPPRGRPAGGGARSGS